MKTIKELNDAVLLGKDGLSDKSPRLAARAVLRRRDGKYALMFIEKFNLYCLPGGGVERGEKLLDALKREIESILPEFFLAAFRKTEPATILHRSPSILP
mgnify:CR=1 FL=1